MGKKDFSYASGIYLTLPDAPSLPGLTFRLFRGLEDLPAVEAVREAVRATDGDIWLPGPDNSDVTCNPVQDCLLAEVSGQVIGYTWLDWWMETDGTRLYLHLGWLLPEWRRKGIGRALLSWQEHRLRQIAQSYVSTGSCVFGGNADEGQLANRALLLSEGYKVAFTRVQMVCQISTIPMSLTQLPDGLEIRPVELEHLPIIYQLNEEIFSASRLGYSPDKYEDWLRELGWPELDTNLWVVAWDGDQIAGYVVSTSNEEGVHTPWVAVHPSWRRRGLAKALMMRMLQRCRERGFKQARLETIAENPGQTVHLYEGVGYQVVLRQPRYRKAM